MAKKTVPPTVDMEVLEDILGQFNDAIAVVKVATASLGDGSAIEQSALRNALTGLNNAYNELDVTISASRLRASARSIDRRRKAEVQS